jgi:hypothetical protein
MMATGRPDDVRTLPTVTPSGTRRVEVEAGSVAVALRTMRSLPYVREATIFGLGVHAVIEASVTDAQLYRDLDARGHAPESIRDIAPSLEDAFVSLTRSAANDARSRSARRSKRHPAERLEGLDRCGTASRRSSTRSGSTSAATGRPC